MTYVLCCSDHSNPAPLSATATTITGLCADPTLLSTVPDDADRLVLGLHLADADLSRFQASMRKLGFDPLGVGIVDLTHFTTPAAVEIVLAGVIARTEAFAGATPEQIKLEPAGRISRRSLLSALALLSIGAPAIDHDLCVARDGCRACVVACPVDALSWRGGVVEYDKTVCVTCGICITTCPTGAVVNPTITREGIEAQIRAIIETAAVPPGIRFVCRTAEPRNRPGFFDVGVACTGMLTPGWLLAPLTLGAASVDALSCDQGGCRLENEGQLATAVTDARTVLTTLGIEKERIAGDPRPGLLPLGAVASPGILAPGADTRVIRELARLVGVTDAKADLRSAQLGTIRIDPTTCTACRMCAHLCPTDALSSASLLDGIVIDFDPGACVGCSQCLTICPEIERGAISLEIRFDLQDWENGRREVRRDTAPRCERCGKPIAPSAMLDRITAMLGPEHAKTLELLTTLCLDCRGR
ncbi:MAG: 4Fe-4S dicluster domain-containing protein [Acidimicrobiia bacterium]